MSMNRREVVGLAVSSLASAALTPISVRAQAQYPDRPIRLIVPFAAGGVVDVVGRLWADKMKGPLGTVVVENRGGASGTIGAAEVARATPDGYTLLLGNTSTQALNPVIMPHALYDPAKDFTAIGILANSAIAIGVNPSVPAKNLTELVAYIKANPGKASYGSAGTGTYTNLAGEMFKQLAGTPDLTHIPYKGGGPVVSDVISGHIPMMMINITSQILALHKSGKIRIVAVFTPKRLSVLPDVQAAAETYPSLVAMLFTGVFAPAATPKPIVERIAQASRTAVASAEFKQKLLSAGLEPVVDTPDEAQRFVAAEHARIVKLVPSLGFKLK